MTTKHNIGDIVFYNGFCGLNSGEIVSIHINDIGVEYALKGGDILKDEDILSNEEALAKFEEKAIKFEEGEIKRLNERLEKAGSRKRVKIVVEEKE